MGEPFECGWDKKERGGDTKETLSFSVFCKAGNSLKIQCYNQVEKGKSHWETNWALQGRCWGHGTNCGGGNTDYKIRHSGACFLSLPTMDSEQEILSMVSFHCTANNPQTPEGLQACRVWPCLSHSFAGPPITLPFLRTHQARSLLGKLFPGSWPGNFYLSSFHVSPWKSLLWPIFLKQTPLYQSLL